MKIKGSYKKKKKTRRIHRVHIWFILDQAKG